jgi:hypothetical protein
MSKVTVVRYQTTVEAADENQRLVEQVYSELAANDPGGLRYATFRLDDGVTFVHVSFVDGEENPLLTTAAFQAFQAGLSGRVVQGPEPRSAVVVGSYRL